MTYDQSADIYSTFTNELDTLLDCGSSHIGSMAGGWHYYPVDSTDGFDYFDSNSVMLDDFDSDSLGLDDFDSDSVDLDVFDSVDDLNDFDSDYLGNDDLDYHDDS